MRKTFFAVPSVKWQCISRDQYLFVCFKKKSFSNYILAFIFAYKWDNFTNPLLLPKHLIFVYKQIDHVKHGYYLCNAPRFVYLAKKNILPVNPVYRVCDVMWYGCKKRNGDASICLMYMRYLLNYLNSVCFTRKKKSIVIYVQIPFFFCCCLCWKDVSVDLTYVLDIQIHAVSVF